MKLDIEAELATLERIRSAYGFQGYETACFEALTRLKRIGELAKTLADCVLSKDQLEVAKILQLCGVRERAAK